MKIGLCAINMGVCVEPALAAEVAGLAEAAGFESIWAGEQRVCIARRASSAPSIRELQTAQDPPGPPLYESTAVAMRGCNSAIRLM